MDRNGTVLVDNRISVQITIDRTIIDELEGNERTSVLTKVAEGLARSGTPKTVEQLEADLANQRYSPYVPVPVAGDVPEELKIWIDEHGAELPGVSAERVAVRRYPYGQLAAHVIGYTGQIIDEEFGDQGRVDEAVHPERRDREVRAWRRSTRTICAARPARGHIEVDAENNPIRVVEETRPIAGDDVVLNLDIDVQAQAEQALQSGLTIAKGRPCTGCTAACQGSGRIHGRPRSAQRAA